MSEINDIEKLTDVIFTIDLKNIDKYQHKDPILEAKYTTGTYQKCSFCEGSNKQLQLKRVRMTFYSANNPNLCITLVPYVYPS